MPVVMGLDQHRAQIAAEWIDTITGEIARTRGGPREPVSVRSLMQPIARDGPAVRQ